MAQGQGSLKVQISFRTLRGLGLFLCPLMQLGATPSLTRLVARQSPPSPAELGGSSTCNPAPKGNAHSAEAVVGHGCNFPSTAGPMVVAVLLVGVGHGVRIIGVQVVAAFRALGERAA